MSGGSYGYICYRIEELCVGKMYDAELDEMMNDIANMLHDLEWWQSGDFGEEKYRKSAKEFKQKWFTADRSERLQTIINKKCDELKKELAKML